MEFMHTHNVVHRDLTSNNLLVTDKWEAKVISLASLAPITLAEMPIPLQHQWIAHSEWQVTKHQRKALWYEGP